MGSTTVWFTGLPASGKTTLAEAVERALESKGRSGFVIDGDVLRRGLTSDLGFTRADRAESVRRAGEVAMILAQAGILALVSLVSPYREHRDLVRQRYRDARLRFIEVHVATPIEVCEARDPKGLYALARRGEIQDMTGVDDPYEPPERPDLVCGRGGDIARDVKSVLEAIEASRGMPGV